MADGFNIARVLLLMLPATAFLVAVATAITWVQNKMAIERRINSVSADGPLPSTAVCVGDRVLIRNKSNYY
jgi:hypothetical protein